MDFILLLAILLVLVATVASSRSASPTATSNGSGAVIIELKAQIENLTEQIRSVEQNQSQSGTVLTSLHSSLQARQDLEQRTADSMRRLETVIAGTQTKGLAGENIINHLISDLPSDWQVRNFPVGGKQVEFGLRLPNNLILPIDSKWAASSLVAEFSECEDIVEQQRLKKEISKVVLNKAKEVKKYIDPSLTTAFGIAAVPDAVYHLSTECLVEAMSMNVVVISYSLLLPYLLLVIQTVAKMDNTTDIQQLQNHLQSSEESLQSLQMEVERRFSRALAMLTNTRDEMRGQISRAKAGLVNAQAGKWDTDGAVLEIVETSQEAA